MNEEKPPAAGAPLQRNVRLSFSKRIERLIKAVPTVKQRDQIMAVAAEADEMLKETDYIFDEVKRMSQKTEALLQMVENYNRSIWSDSLVCEWICWRVIGDKALALDAPDSNFCDMTAAIKLGQTLCPAVERIESHVGGRLDLVYMKRARDGKWVCYRRSKA